LVCFQQRRTVEVREQIGSIAEPERERVHVDSLRRDRPRRIEVLGWWDATRTMMMAISSPLPARIAPRPGFDPKLERTQTLVAAGDPKSTRIVVSVWERRKSSSGVTTVAPFSALTTSAK
jgi:hypothetical protein